MSLKELLNDNWGSNADSRVRYLATLKPPPRHLKFLHTKIIENIVYTLSLFKHILSITCTILQAYSSTIESDKMEIPFQ